jgi:hypothetical protein
MKIARAFSRLGLAVVSLTLASLSVPTGASAALIDYRAVITVNSGSTRLGYLADDPNYWTPLINPASSGALIVDFTLDGTLGTRINLDPETYSQGAFPYFGAVEGRDSTSADIAAGSFNYLYLGGTNGTAPGSTAQAGDYFSTSTGLAKPGESAVWNIDVIAGTLLLQWINTDGSAPPTFLFVQSNHVYGGGDPAAFMSRFPAPVTPVTLGLEILSATPQPPTVPEPTSLMLLGTGIAGLAVRVRNRRRA